MMTGRAEGLAVMRADALCQRWPRACNACAADAHLARLLGSRARAGVAPLLRGSGNPTRLAGTSMHLSIIHAGQHGAGHPCLLRR